jgi:hypothetical protein
MFIEFGPFGSGSSSAQGQRANGVVGRPTGSWQGLLFDGDRMCQAGAAAAVKDVASPPSLRQGADQPLNMANREQTAQAHDLPTQPRRGRQLSRL